jgi:hypothetical protein
VVPGTGDTSAKLTVNVNNGGSAVFAPGDYKVRLQAVGYPGGPAYAYGQTAIITLTVS